METEERDFEIIYHNGVSHIESAKFLASNNYYGFAISHLILGIEELIKYQVVRTNIADPTVFGEQITSPTGKESVFKKHGSKHNLIKEFQEAISPDFPEDFLQMQFREMQNMELEEKHMIIKNNRFKQFGSFLSIAYSELNIPVEKKQAFFNWLKSANSLKNDGFYVSDSMVSPKAISKESYETALEYANTILHQTTVLIDLDKGLDELEDWIKI